MAKKKKGTKYPSGTPGKGSGNGIPFGHPDHPLSGKEAGRINSVHHKTKRKQKVDTVLEGLAGAVADDTIDKDKLGDLALTALKEILVNTDDDRLKGTTAKTLLDFTKSKPTAYTESKIEVTEEPTSEELLEEFDETIIDEKKDSIVIDNNTDPKVKH